MSSFDETVVTGSKNCNFRLSFCHFLCIASKFTLHTADLRNSQDISMTTCIYLHVCCGLTTTGMPLTCKDVSLHTTVTSSKKNVFRVTGPLWGESADHRWIPFTKTSDVELWYFLWSAPEQTIEQIIEIPVIWDAIKLIMTSLYC